MKFVMIALLALSTSAFANQERDAAEIRATIKAASTLAQANLSCTKKSHCAAIPVGSRACGGPTGYLLVSTKNVNYRQIVDLALTSADLEERFNVRYSVFSICSVETAPSVGCVDKVCQ